MKQFVLMEWFLSGAIICFGCSSWDHGAYLWRRMGCVHTVVQELRQSALWFAAVCSSIVLTGHSDSESRSQFDLSFGRFGF